MTILKIETTGTSRNLNLNNFFSFVLHLFVDYSTGLAFYVILISPWIMTDHVFWGHSRMIFKVTIMFICQRMVTSQIVKQMLRTSVVMFCAIWYHFQNLKNMKNTYGGVLLLVTLQVLACNFTKSKTPHVVFHVVWVKQMVPNCAKHLTWIQFRSYISQRKYFSEINEILPGLFRKILTKKPLVYGIKLILCLQ